MGLKQSFTEMSLEDELSNCCNNGVAVLLEKKSPGSNRTGNLLIVAPAAAVIILVAPGPIELVHTKVCNRFFILAYAAAACTIDCSFRI